MTGRLDLRLTDPERGGAVAPESRAYVKATLGEKPFTFSLANAETRRSKLSLPRSSSGYQDPTLTSPPVAMPRKCHVPLARNVLAVPKVSSINCR